MSTSDSTTLTKGVLGEVERRLGRTARVFAGQLDDLRRAISRADAGACEDGAAELDESGRPLRTGEEENEDGDELGSR